ncbi:MAG: flagellar hook-length control protein FliK [Azoarcus sp.]|jgi:flagellar hook-length control protein FliK|nr:flagellar hook-length control protein FliK [Azoarcus sp.]
MATPVSSNISNLTASGMAANTDALRGASDTRFSELLRNQMQTGIGARPLSSSPSPVAETRSAPRTNHAPSRESAPSPASGPRERSPSHEPRRAANPERPPTRADDPPAGRDAPDATEAPAARAQDTDDAEGEAPPTASAPTPEDADANAAAPQAEAQPQVQTQPQAVETAIAPVLPATIAALPDALAGTDGGDSAPDDAAAEETDIGASTRDAPGGRARRMATMAGNIPADPAGNNAAARPESATTSHPRAAAPAPGIEAAIPGLRADILAARAGTGTQQTATAGSGGETTPVPLTNALRTAAQESAALPRFTVSTAVGQRAWAEETGNKIMWMLGRAESRAELVLTPPHLGKVEVSINLNGDQTTAQFVAASQAARDALEQAMPRLRELLAQAGIDLGEASVDTSGESQAQNDERARATGRALGGDHDDGNDNAATVTSTKWVKPDNGLVDTFA